MGKLRVAVVVVCASLVGTSGACGSKDAVTADTGDGGLPEGGDVSDAGGILPDPHAQSIQALLDKMDENEALPCGADLVTFAALLPDVKKATADAEAEAVLVTFNDARPLTLSLQPEERGDPHTDAPGPTPSTKAPLPFGVSSTSTAFAFFTLAGDFFRNPLGDIASSLHAAQYSLGSAAGTVPQMMDMDGKLGQAGVVYIGSHGSTFQPNSLINGGAQPAKEFELWTATCETEAGIPADYMRMIGDLPVPQLTTDAARKFLTASTVGCMHGNGNPERRATSEVHFAITRKFVEKYWHFKKEKTVVFVDTCESDSPGAANIKWQIFTQGAAAYG